MNQAFLKKKACFSQWSIFLLKIVLFLSCKKTFFTKKWKTNLPWTVHTVLLTVLLSKQKAKEKESHRTSNLLRFFAFVAKPMPFRLSHSQLWPFSRCLLRFMLIASRKLLMTILDVLLCWKLWGLRIENVGTIDIPFCKPHACFKMWAKRFLGTNCTFLGFIKLNFSLTEFETWLMEVVLFNVEGNEKECSQNNVKVLYALWSKKPEQMYHAGG